MGMFDQPPQPIKKPEGSPATESEAMLPSSRTAEVAFDSNREMQRMQESSFASFFLAPEEQNINKRLALKAKFKQAVEKQLEGITGEARSVELEKIRSELLNTKTAATKALGDLYAQAPEGRLSYATGGISRSSPKGRLHDSWKLTLERAQAFFDSLPS